jgi:DNA-3-methyladenine glycosylase
VTAPSGDALLARESITRLPRSALPYDTIELARFLIGTTLVRQLPDLQLIGRIVETEAYPPGDASCHAFRGETRRNRSLFLERGYAYIYLNYGLFHLLNVSSESKGIGAGVLIRAVEPLAGMAEMSRRRGTNRITDLTRGPGRLTDAMGIDLSFDGIDLTCDEALWLGRPVKPTGAICASVRIGISREAHQLRRFYECGNPFVSGPKGLNRNASAVPRRSRA